MSEAREEERMRDHSWLIAGVLMLCATTAQAQIGRDVLERSSNRAQISEGKAALERDSKELGTFTGHLNTLRGAVRAGDESAANLTLGALKPELSTEAQQTAGKAEAAKREVAGSASETGSNRRESRRNRADSNSLGRSSDDEADAIRDGINRVDDARDLADDKADLGALAKLAQRQQQIAQALGPYDFDLGSDTGRTDAASKLALLEEFEKLMEQDIAATQAELSEDRKEAGEDRRETRDDVREADELDNRYRRQTGDYRRRR
jgi:hypothetical protein